MGFRYARDAAIAALLGGQVQHEARDDIDDKTLLATGAVTSEGVVRLLRACRGTQYSCSPHHQLVKNVEVHEFKPIGSLEPGGPKLKWYIKLYFLDPDTWFISVHHSKG